MRCYCCDYDSHLGSYYLGISSSGKRRDVKYDENFKEWLCTECIVAIRTGKTKEERQNEDYIVSLTTEFYNVPKKDD